MTARDSSPSTDPQRADRTASVRRADPTRTDPNRTADRTPPNGAWPSRGGGGNAAVVQMLRQAGHPWAQREQPTAAAGPHAESTDAAASVRIQRRVVVDNPAAPRRLVKSGRHDFSNALTAAMPVGPNQARCHTVSYEEITASVEHAVNEALAAANANPLAYLWGLVSAVFPTGAQLPAHHQNSPALAPVCASQYAAAQAALASLNTLMSNPPVNFQTVVSATAFANDLIRALNNSPANLRLGASNTNSSIQGGLDLAPATQPRATLRRGTSLIDQTQPFTEHGYQTVPLASDTDVLRVDELHEFQVWQLLSRTQSNTGQLHLFSSGPLLQSSNYANMATGTMTNTNPEPVAILVPGSNPPTYYMFQP